MRVLIAAGQLEHANELLGATPLTLNLSANPRFDLDRLMARIELALALEDTDSALTGSRYFSGVLEKSCNYFNILSRRCRCMDRAWHAWAKPSRRSPR